MKKDVSLVLASGGARGLAHIGAIYELEQQGYKITSVAGASMGALIGGVYASGKLQDFCDWMITLNKREIFSLFDFTLSPNGIVKGNKILSSMKKVVPDNRIEDLDIPFTAVATDIISRTEVVFDSGNLYDAIRASISIPSFFKPCKRKNMVLVDGGVINPLPLNRIKRSDNDLLVAVDVNAPIVCKTKFIKEQKQIHSNSLKLFDKVLLATDNILDSDLLDLNYYTVLSQSLGVMIQKISRLSLELHKPDVLVNIPMNACKVLEFHRYDEMIELGRKATRQALSQL